MKDNILKVSNIILSLVIILGTFLPWSELRSAASILGFESSYYQSTLGVEHPLGIFTVVLGGLCFLLTLIAKKWALIPGLISFLICLVVAVGIGKMTYMVSSTVGYAYAGTGIGVYISMLASLGVTFIGTLAFIKPPTVYDNIASNRPPIEPTISSAEVIQASNKEDRKLIGKICAISGGIVLIIIGGGYAVEKILNYIDHHENQKLNQQDGNSQESVLYTEADSLAAAEAFQNQIKHETDSLEMIQHMSERTEIKQKEEEFQKDFDDSKAPSEFPFEATITSPKCYLYAEPNVNSERKAEILQETDLNVMASQNQFFFCSYQDSTGKVQTGWIYYNDVGR